MLDPDQVYIPLASWIQIAIEWIADHFRPLFRSIRWPVDELLNAINGTLEVTPPLLLIALFGLLALWLAGRRTALFTVVSLVFILLLGIWYETLTTLSLIATAIVVCVAIGIPLGILCARSDRAWGILRPILDVMQTTPSFVYLIPVVMLFGVGTVPGAVAVIVVAVPPLETSSQPASESAAANSTRSTLSLTLSSARRVAWWDLPGFTAFPRVASRVRFKRCRGACAGSLPGLR